MPESTGLRWWQEEESAAAAGAASPVVTSTVSPASAVATAAPPVAVAAPVTDFDAELEAEAWRRVAQLQSGERVEIYPDVRRNIQRLRRRLFWTMLPFVAWALLVALALHNVLWVGAAVFYILEAFILCRIFERKYRRHTGPAITLTDEGIEIRTILYDLGLLRWEEIEDIRPLWRLFGYVAIRPRDTRALCRRLGWKRSWAVWLNRPFQRHPIWLAQQNLPLKANELVQRIEEFRARRGV